jgi:hypothetical protein
MAAPPAKPSPSNQEVKTQQQTNNGGGSNGKPNNDGAVVAATAAATATTKARPGVEIQLKAPPSYSSVAAAAAVAASADATNAAVPADSAPTYEGTERSEHFWLARELLNNGNFEEALSVIEEELESTKSRLMATAGACAMDVELHESIAPLHYLYGTTLLYSIEEAKDGNDANAMTTIDATVVPSHQGQNDEEEEDDDDGEEEEDEEQEDDSKPAAVNKTQEEEPVATAGPVMDDSNPWAHLPSSSSTIPMVAAAAAAAAPSPEVQEEGEYAGGPAAGDDAEDIQIAWENLEAARTILERMLTLPGLSESFESKLKLYVYHPQHAYA